MKLFISLLLVFLIIQFLRTKVNDLYVIIIYAILLLTVSLEYISIFIKTMSYADILLIKSINIVRICLALVIVIIFYVVEKMIFNLVFNKVLILDIKYYFFGKINKFQYTISIVISFLEEVAFRLPLIIYKKQEYEALLLLVIATSIIFGINHLFFSTYNAFSKIVLGIILGTIAVYEESILIVILLHIIYNYLTSINYDRKGG